MPPHDEASGAKSFTFKVLLMKTNRLLSVALGLAALAVLPMQAETKSPYTVDFETAINTSNHSFKVASNWKHIVDSYNDGYSDYYMNYSYKSSGGVDGSGCLYAPKQEAGDNWDNGEVKDVLVTPPVSGKISFDIKAYSTSGFFVEIYEIKADGTLGSRLVRKTTSDGLNTSEFKTVEYTPAATEAARYGLRLSYCYIDNFAAESAEIEAEKSINIVSAVPKDCEYNGDGNNSTIYWYQQPDGQVLVKYSVTVTNNGEVALTQGMENYSVSIINEKTGAVVSTVAVPQDLAIGATSEPFDVSALVGTDTWPYSTSNSIKFGLRENLQESKLSRAPSGYRAFEPKFVFREADSSTTSSLSATQSFGMISEVTSKKYVIYNDGIAVLMVKSITLPEGFTSTDAPTATLFINAKGSREFTISTPSAAGKYNGNLEIVYLDKDNKTEKTYTLPFSATMVSADTWTATFDNSLNEEAVYPAGSVAEAGITGGKASYSDGVNNMYLKSYTSSSFKESENLFITPKLHAAAGDKLTFDVARDSRDGNADSFIKVFVSTDRVNWGEPVATYTQTDITSSTMTGKEISFAAEGDYYVAFAIYRMCLDNLAGLTKVNVARDIYFAAVTQEDAVQSGVQKSYKVKLIPLTAAAAKDYTVKFYVNDEAVATATSVALKASSKDANEFSMDYSATSDATVTYPTYYEVAFTDGTVFKTPVKNLTVTCEPEFVFFDFGSKVYGYKPTTRTAPVTFGKVTEAGIAQHFDIYNWGAGKLTVSAIRVPEGFEAKFSETESGNTTLTDASAGCEIAGKDRKHLDIIFAASEVGAYSGDIEIDYKDAAGATQTFKLAVSGTILDANKWYVTFDKTENNGSDSPAAVYPAGSVRQKNVSADNKGTYDKVNFALVSSGSTNNIFATPKLHAEAGEQIQFDAMKRYYAAGSIKVYTAASLDDILDDAKRTEIFNEAIAESAFTTYSATIAEAGDYVLGFEIKDAFVDEIYGLSPVAVDHIISIAGCEVPAEATQNKNSVIKLSLYNYNSKAEAADSYTVTGYAGDNAISAEGSVEIAMNPEFGKNATVISIPFRSPEAGTFPVYAEVKFADGFTITTEATDVTFAAEKLETAKMVGKEDNTNNGAIYVNDKKSLAVMVYTADELGLNDGAKISHIGIKGYNTETKADFVPEISIYYEWVDAATVEKPTTFNIDELAEGMTLLYHSTDKLPTFQKTEPGELISINPTDMVYPAGKALKIVTSHTAAAWSTQCKLVIDQTAGLIFCAHNDTQLSSWSDTKNRPVLYMDLDVQAASITGTVTNADNQPVADATVTLVSNDGDNIQYKGKTNAEGKYSINVIQNNRTYEVAASDGANEDFVENVKVEGTYAQDLSLCPVVNIAADNAAAIADIENAIVKFNLDLSAGYNAIALPFALSAEQIADKFGEDAKVYALTDAEVTAGEATLTFSKESAMEAGRPYMLYVYSAPEHFKAKGHKTVSAVLPKSVNGVMFTAAYTANEATEGEIVLTNDHFIGLVDADINENALQPFSTSTPAFSAIVKSSGATPLTSAKFKVSETPTGIDNIGVDQIDENDVIYNLQGVRVTAPSAGIYIVNGKKVIIR